MKLYDQGVLVAGRAWGRRRSLTVPIALAVPLLLALRLRGESHFDYRFDNYQEEANRIHVRTHSAQLELPVGSSVLLNAELVYDAISGATPTGGPPPDGSRKVPMAHLTDERTAGNIQSAIRWGRNTTTPQFAYSLENDYESVGLSLNHSIDFNEKNTTLALGVAYTYDTIMPEFWLGDKDYKNGGDAFVGLTQLLGPKTVLTANLTVGTAHGYLSDPYKRVRFFDYPEPAVLFSEKRPNDRTKEIGLVSLTQFFTPLDASAELSYRLYHDSYGIVSHTLGLSWFQKIGKHVVLSPLFRFADQSAAKFYATQFPGDPTLPPDDPFLLHHVPNHYSSDYRLSALQTFTYGLSAMIKIEERYALDLSYQRYEMIGRDNVTAASAYPNANTFSIGFRIWF